MQAYYAETDEEVGAVCDECGSEFEDEDSLDIVRGERDGVYHGLCEECARDLAKTYGIAVSDEAARLFEDEGEKIAESVIPYLYTYDELMALVRKDIAERRLTGYIPDVKKIDDALHKFCKWNDEFFTEYLDELNRGEKK